MLHQGTWLAAVSSGPDSMALIQMCLEEGISVSAAHVNYHHRPSADQEEQYVRSYCRKNGLTCHVLNQPFVYSGNFEAAARTWRYDYFVQLVQKYGYAGVLIAHQQDDAIETWMMQKEKNLIPMHYGLQEISRYHGVKIVRPLLGKSKQDLKEYCESRHVRYYLDETNADPVYARSRMRQKVQKMSAQQRRQAVQEIREDNVHLHSVRRQASSLIRRHVVSIADYRQKPQEVRLCILRTLLEKPDQEKGRLSLRFLQEMDDVIRKKKDFMILAGKQILVQENGKMSVQKPVLPYRYELKQEKMLKTPYFHMSRSGSRINGVTVKKEDYPLVIRSAEPGDAILLRYGHKNVHRFFVDRHISLYRRALWPVVANASGEIILVPGIGCNLAHFTIKPTFYVLQ